MKGTVVVGMSGGVDSSVAAYLLKKEGYRVIGVTMQIWQDEAAEQMEREGGCCGFSAVTDAARVAQRLEIPHYVMNFRAPFQHCVIDDFIEEYRRGRTPNPCIRCNRFVKWESLLQRSLSIGADYIATGHYARIVRRPDGRYAVRRAAHDEKDQSYALYSLTQEQLAHTLMPVGGYAKPEIRHIAEEIGLSVAHKPDSQEICFVPDHDYAGFIARETGTQEPQGNFVTADGRILGRHRGISHYTIGQRRGLRLAMGHPVFVCAIRPETNEVVVGDAASLLTTELTADGLCHMAAASFPIGMKMTAKIRYSHPGVACTVVESDEKHIRVRFEQPVRAAAPGQAAVFYDGDDVLGGGTIC